MRLELRATGGPTCERCGSFELLHTAATHEQFVEDITDLINQSTQVDALLQAHAHLDAALADVNGLRVLKRRQRRVLREELQRTVDRMLDRTRLI